jgi:uncharacterized cupin superfamily protein
MERKPAVVMRADEIAARRRWFSQRLNPESRFLGASLGGRAGLTRTGVNLATLPPGKESFAFHAHWSEEEWIYILRGRAVLDIDAGPVELGPGDFVAFPAPSVAHNLKNPFDEEVQYLMGGENRAQEIIDYPRLGKRYLLVSGDKLTDFYELRDPIQPFGPAEEK